MISGKGNETMMLEEETYIAKCSKEKYSGEKIHFLELAA